MRPAHSDNITLRFILILSLAVGCTSDRPDRIPRDSAHAAALRGRGQLPSLNMSPALQRALATRGINVQYRWVRAGSLSATQNRASFIDPWTGDTLSLADTSFLDLSGVQSAQITRTGDGAMIVLHLTDSAAERILTETDAHVGQKVGVLLNGELVSVATITSPMSTMMPLITDVPVATATEIGRRIMGARDTSDTAR